MVSPVSPVACYAERSSILTIPTSATSATSTRARIFRATLVALVWALGALPLVTPHARCPIARVIHRPCPGCGMTRALGLLLRGDFAASLAMHPLAVPTLAVQIWIAVMTVIVTLRRGSPFALVEGERDGADEAMRRLLRRLVAAFAGVMVLDVVLWAMRSVGLFGGPVAI